MSTALRAQHEHLTQAMAADQDNQPSSPRVVQAVLSATPQSEIALAHELLLRGQYEAAIKQLETIRQSDPYDVSGWFLLGQAYGALGRLE